MGGVVFFLVLVYFCRFVLFVRFFMVVVLFLPIIWAGRGGAQRGGRRRSRRLRPSLALPRRHRLGRRAGQQGHGRIIIIPLGVTPPTLDARSGGRAGGELLG